MSSRRGPLRTAAPTLNCACWCHVLVSGWVNGGRTNPCASKGRLGQRRGKRSRACHAFKAVTSSVPDALVVARLHPDHGRLGFGYAHGPSHCSTQRPRYILPGSVCRLVKPACIGSSSLLVRHRQDHAKTRAASLPAWLRILCLPRGRRRGNHQIGTCRNVTPNSYRSKSITGIFLEISRSFAWRPSDLVLSSLYRQVNPA